jgi:hypothetical protein
MRYQHSLLLYQDEPGYGLFLKLIFIIIPASLLISSYFLFSSGEKEGGLVLLLEAFVISLIFLAVFPRKYQVYEDHIRVVLGGPFFVRMGFDRINKIVLAHSYSSVLTMNFVTRFSSNYVRIEAGRGMSLAITPQDYNLFIENANRALAEWTRENPREND